MHYSFFHILLLILNLETLFVLLSLILDFSAVFENTYFTFFFRFEKKHDFLRFF